LNTEFFPDLTAFSKLSKEAIRLPSGALLDGIDCVAYALSSDKNNAVFTGMVLKVVPGEGLTLFAGNGICLAEYKSPINYSGPEINAIIPGNIANKVSRSFFDDGDLLLSIDGRRISVCGPNLLVGGPLIQDSYPDYHSILPVPDKSVVVDRVVLTDNLINLNYEAATVDENRVVMVFEGGNISLRCGGSENLGIKSEGFNGQAKFEVNLKLLVLSMKNLGGDQVKISFNDDTSPIHLSSLENFASGASLKCVVVPLNPES